MSVYFDLRFGSLWELNAWDAHGLLWTRVFGFRAAGFVFPPFTSSRDRDTLLSFIFSKLQVDESHVIARMGRETAAVGSRPSPPTASPSRQQTLCLTLAGACLTNPKPPTPKSPNLTT